MIQSLSCFTLKPIHVLSVAMMASIMGLFAPQTQAAIPEPAIRIDGTLGDAAWEQARSLAAFKTLAGKEPLAQTKGAMFHDRDYLYLSFHCQEPLMKKREMRSLGRDGRLWTNDCVEIYIAPFANTNEYYHIVVDATGEVFDALKRDGELNAHYDTGIIARVQNQRDSWTVEIAIPLADVGLSNARSARMNFCRERKAVLEDTSWHGGFGRPETWQQVELALDQRYGVDVSEWRYGDPFPQYGRNEQVLEFTSRQATALEVLFYEQQGQRWKLVAKQALSPTPGRSLRVVFPYALSLQHRPSALRSVLQSKGQAIFRSTYRLILPAEPLHVTMALPYYYSEEKRGRLQLQTFVSAASLKSSSIRLTVAGPQGQLGSVQEIIAPQKIQETEFDISGWQNGIGTVTAELITDARVLARPSLPVAKRSGPFTSVSRKRNLSQ